MTAQILASELGNLIQESKRKHTELRNAAEKSLDELKDLSQRPNFVTPFVIACGTKNVKFTGIAIVCLQRLVVSRALPRSRLREVLEAFKEATSAGLDVQLKILQALPSLLQNYADDLKGELIAASLNICTILQASKNAIVNNTAAATLQQLVVSVFDKVVAEDKIALELPTVGEAPIEDGTVQLRAAALDAYKVFNDLCLLTESQKPQFLKAAGLPQTFGLELIESVLTNHATVFLNHPEQANILRIRVMPFIISALSEKLNFAVTVRIVRILYTLLRNHLSILTSEGEMSLGLLTHMLDHDTALWKRSLCMEALRGIFADSTLVRRVFAMYDAQDGRKNILRDLVAAFVRLSTEKPAVIGLGPQSTIPVMSQGSSSGSDQAMLEASGVPGIISSSVSSNEPSVGVSTQWSTMRVPCIDQLDKTEAPVIPESYIYSLTLACISGFSEGLAKFILPLTVPDRPRKKARQSEFEPHDSMPGSPDPRIKLERRTSIKKNPIPVNPLTLEDHPLFEDVRICARIVDDCWPAILATCSTFLYAALDTEYYHGLVRSFQKFTHVAGLLRLATPRDAFLTTLGKAAVPSNVLAANTPAAPVPPTPSIEKQSIFSNAKGLLSVDTLVSQSSDRGRQSSVDSSPTSLNTRNLLCLRALLNLGIALGPTLDSAWAIVLGTLQQADLVLFSSTKSARTPNTNQRPESQSSNDGSALLANFGTEIKAVETAASRLLESTIDFPNEAFVEVVTALCSLFGREEMPKQQPEVTNTSDPPSPKSRRPSHGHRGLHSINTAPATQNQEDLFALAKLGDVASINIGRLMNYDPRTSGWAALTSELTSAACSPSTPSSVRLRAAEILVRLVLEAATATLSLPEELRRDVQLRLLQTYKKAILPLESDEREISVSIHATDIDVHKVILEGLKSILEQCGETFVDGWDIAFSIIGSVFVNNAAQIHGTVKDSRESTTRSARLIRSSFNSLQLICSDFLSSLPNACFIILVDTLYNFCTQDDDLNISLTTVTFFWVLSDFISGRTTSFSLSPNLIKGVNEENLVEMASGDDLSVSDAALWMLLLLRLTSVTTDERLELRNSAIQTLLRIFDAYGDQLSPEAWTMCLNSVIFKLLSSIEVQLQSTHEEDSSVSDKDKTGWNETTVVVLTGITNLLADYLDVLSSHPSFSKSWDALLGHFKALLDFNVLEINTAVFKSLRQILSRGNIKEGSASNFDRHALDLVWDLWSTSLPVVKSVPTNKRFDNQNYLLAYSAALQEIYRLIQADIGDERVQRMLILLREAIQQASAATYSADIEYLTPLQSQVLECLKMIRTDIEGVPAALIGQVAEFVALAFEPRCPSETQRPTYVALSKASMALSESLIIAHSSDHEIYNSGAVSSALTALARPIVMKYSFPLVTKSISPWRQATTSFLAVLKSILPVLTKSSLTSEVVSNLWTSIITIGNGIMAADCASLSSTATIPADQDFDITSFITLRDLITPALGSSSIPDKTRLTYTKSLFHRSLIHAPLPSELPQPSQELLSTLYQTRTGRTVDPVPARRAKMSYVCMDALFSLVALNDGSAPRIKLAQAAAPYLILRAGLTLRAYIADQPLRGRMPQPLSQRRELLYILKALVKLSCEPEAIPDSTGVESEGKKHLFWLYPLLAKAVRAASRDMEVLEWVGKALDVVGGEFGVGES
ncbi:probable MON2 Peripheral membrane protein with a role in endocytosis and vacuole integrity [Rhynchosporium secalis]|uniref:Probable MON2 Peripheral membrane protein with a role in endocytosis and vacuole integrity n=1 Tax=Rhynchosporium secalis TaxID=38038 RepID=A0A1E1M1Y9_RHYSE|nr:probable MON2 Peripheral membrane protein with a role in endocytosis and vacuole integrity [Rhynchosporium secalis]